ncbi:MAG TPA: transposase [Opitutales bacterium]|nr:transposase [Opitutales bacterium]
MEKTNQPGSDENENGNGNAELQLGPSPGTWHSRGYLPHFDRIGNLQSITFRLADSLPQSKLSELKAMIEALADQADSEKIKREQIEAWLDAGLGCCALKHPQVAENMEAALLHFDADRYRLIAWCVMPNHVHVLIEPKIELSKIVQSWKSYTGRWAKEKNAELELGVPEGRPFWMREYWDRYIRNERHLGNVIEYIHMNPVKAKLCSKPEQWPYSSAHRSRPTNKLPGTPSSSSAPTKKA